MTTTGAQVLGRLSGVEEEVIKVKEVLETKVAGIDQEITVARSGLSEVKRAIDKLPALEAKVESYTEALSQQQATISGLTINELGKVNNNMMEVATRVAELEGIIKAIQEDKKGFKEKGNKEFYDPMKIAVTPLDNKDKWRMRKGKRGGKG